MSVVLRTRMSLADFLPWEPRQELRQEFNGIAPVAITGGTEAREEIRGERRA